MSRTAKLFWTGRSQAVRLPKEFRMQGEEVRIRRHGNGVLLEQVDSGWEWLDEVAGKFSRDFFAEGRAQPEMPKRPGLGTVFEK